MSQERTELPIVYREKQLPDAVIKAVKISYTEKKKIFLIHSKELHRLFIDDISPENYGYRIVGSFSKGLQTFLADKYIQSYLL